MSPEFSFDADAKAPPNGLTYVKIDNIIIDKVMSYRLDLAGGQGFSNFTCLIF